jgi:hypothetical protein
MTVGPTAGKDFDQGGDPVLALTRDLRRFAGEAADAIRNLSHLTDAAPPLPAPEVYGTLGDLEDLGNRLALPLRHLVVGLQRSLDAYDVVQDDGSDPAAAVDRCVFELLQAAADASDLGVRLGRAREAIAGQGHRGRRRPSAPTEED